MTTGLIGGSTAAGGNLIFSNSATGLQIANADTGNIQSMTIWNNSVSNNNAGIDLDLGQSSSMTVTVQTNNLNKQHTQVINLVQTTSATGGAMTAIVRGNTIGTQGVLDSGSEIGSGIRVANGGVSVSLTIDGNIIREVANADGIDVEPQAYVPNLTMRAKIVNNQIIKPTGTAQNIGCGAGVPCGFVSIFVLSDNNTQGGFAHDSTIITNNIVTDPTSWSAGGAGAIYFARRTTTSNTLTIEGNTGLTPRQNVIANNTITNPGPSPASSDFVDEGSPSMPVVVVAVGSTGPYP
jgi:hypothetical protein